MLLIHPPLAKPCEPPAGIARLAGALRTNGLECMMVDANLEAIMVLLRGGEVSANDTWTRRAVRNLEANLSSLRDPAGYENPDRYRRAVADVNRVLDMAGRARGVSLTLANYVDPHLSPLKSQDLYRSWRTPRDNVFYGYFSVRLTQVLEETRAKAVGFSLNYLSQALPAFAMAGFVKERFPGVSLIFGGGLVTSWLRGPAWHNPFSEAIDMLVAGPGEEPLLRFFGLATPPAESHCCPDYSGLPLADYLAPGFILPYAASSGCYWQKCSFCPERAEMNPYQPVPVERVLREVGRLCRQTNPALIHFLDNAISPAVMKGIIEQPPGAPWYGFARVAPELADVGFCRALKESGCVMLKLGLESGDQGVLDATEKGIDLALVSQSLQALEEAGIATYVYLLFGTPAESEDLARRTMAFVERHRTAIRYLNLAVFNLPISSPEVQRLVTSAFYDGDLSLYTDFEHPLGWGRQAIRAFLDTEFKRNRSIDRILKRVPPIFTSNHAPFFAGMVVRGGSCD